MIHSVSFKFSAFARRTQTAFSAGVQRAWIKLLALSSSDFLALLLPSIAARFSGFVSMIFPGLLPHPCGVVCFKGLYKNQFVQ
jgi:hypothetical protein